MSRITKRDFITAVSKRSNLRKDVVEDVLKAVVDISIEEIINNGEFVMKDLFAISNKEWKSYSLAGIHVPEQKRLSIRLSEKVKSFWKLKNEVYPDIGDLSRQDLEDALKHHNETKNSSKSESQSAPTIKSPTNLRTPGSIPTRRPSYPSQTPKTNKVEVDDFNPLLDEED